jgi:hypothetical protein
MISYQLMAEVCAWHHVGPIRNVLWLRFISFISEASSLKELQDLGFAKTPTGMVLSER